MPVNKSPDPAKPQRRHFALWRPLSALWNWLVPPSIAEADRQSRTARMVAVGLILAACVVAVTVVFYNGRSWHRAFKHWQSASLVKDAMKYEQLADEYREAGKTSEYRDTMKRVFDLGNEAYSKNPDNPDAVRIVARTYTRMGASEARWLWNKLDKLNATTDDDVVWRIQALTLMKEDKSAADQIEQVLRERPATQKIVSLADTVMQNLGRRPQLISILREYTRQKPDDLDTRLVLAMRLVEFGGSDREKFEGVGLLWDLTGQQTPVGLRAIEFMDKLKLTPKDANRIIERLEHHPLAKEAHRIAALKRRAALDPGRKGEILRAAVKSHQGMKREDLVPLAHWLYEERLPEQILELLKEDEVLDYPPLLHEYFNALSLLGRFDDLERLVKDPRSHLTTAERDFHYVHLAFVRNTLTNKPMDDIDKLLVNAVNSALRENQVQMLLELGRYADMRKHYRTSMEAYKAASVNPATERAGYEGMLKASYNLGSMKDYASISRETTRRWPTNQFFTEQYVYACLLSGDAIETSAERAKSLLDARPKDSQRKLLVALASHRFGDLESCARHLQDSSLQELTPGQRAVFCGLSRSVGFGDKAAKLVAEIPEATRMLPEEEKFLRAARATPAPGSAGQ